MVGTTQDISIKSEDNAYYAKVTSDSDLQVKAKIWDGTDAVTVTDNKLDVNAAINIPTNLNDALKVDDNDFVCEQSGNFYGTSLDTNVWTADNYNNAMETVANGEVAITTAAQVSSRGEIYTVPLQNRQGAEYKFRARVRLTASDLNIKYIGLKAAQFAQNSYSFAVYGTDAERLRIHIYKGNIANFIFQADWNGDKNFTLDNKYHTYEILYKGNEVVKFYIDGILRHTLDSTNTIASWTDTTNFSVAFRNENLASATSTSMYISSFSISRQGNICTCSETIRGCYMFSIADVPGVASAYNFLSLFNTSSTNKIAIRCITFSAYSVAVTIAKTSIKVNRITASSGGTLAVAANIVKKRTSYPDCIAEIRTANPTVTAVAQMIAFPPPATITAAGATSPPMHFWEAKDNESYIILGKNEGIVFRTTVNGDIDQTFNIAVDWREYF